MDKTELMEKLKKAMANKQKATQPDPEKVKVFVEKLRAMAKVKE